MTKKHDDILVRIEAFNGANGGGVVTSGWRKATRCFAKTRDGRLHGLRPTGKDDEVEIMWWSHRDKWPDRRFRPDGHAARRSDGIRRQGSDWLLLALSCAASALPPAAVAAAAARRARPGAVTAPVADSGRAPPGAVTAPATGAATVPVADSAPVAASGRAPPGHAVAVPSLTRSRRRRADADTAQCRHRARRRPRPRAPRRSRRYTRCCRPPPPIPAAPPGRWKPQPRCRGPAARRPGAVTVPMLTTPHSAAPRPKPAPPRYCHRSRAVADSGRAAPGVLSPQPRLLPAPRRHRYQRRSRPCAAQPTAPQALLPAPMPPRPAPITAPRRPPRRCHRSRAVADPGPAPTGAVTAAVPAANSGRAARPANTGACHVTRPLPTPRRAAADPPLGPYSRPWRARGLLLTALLLCRGPISAARRPARRCRRNRCRR